MKKVSSLLKVITLPEEIKEGIESRSSMLSATLRTITKEDLIQEGLVLVYGILAKKPKAPIPYIMKAVNNRYSSIQRKEIRNKVSNVSLYSEDVVRELDTKIFRQSQRQSVRAKKTSIRSENLLSGVGRGQIEPIVILRDGGMSFKTIAEYLGKDPKTVRRLLKRHGKDTIDNG